jgi:hypothetical protein
MYPGQAYFWKHNANIRATEERWIKKMAITKANLENWFSYHNPQPDQIKKYAAIRDAALAFAEVVVENTPPCADQTAAVRKIREATFTANASIACNGE